MLAILLAAALAAAPATDTIFTGDGGRFQGTVVEESAKGVTVQLADGATKTFAPGQVVRIEYSDGSVSTPKPPPPPPPAAAPAQAPRPAATNDTIFFADGGRARGTVVEETAAGGVTVRMLDGTTRRYPPGQVVRIEYSDGTVSTPMPKAAPAIPPPPPAWPPVPPSQPPPAAPLKTGMPPLIPWYFSFGIGGAGFSGEAETDVRMSAITSGQVTFNLETGLRLSPEIALAAYGNFGVGDAGSVFTGPLLCASAGVDCAAGTAAVGGAIRATFYPFARVTPSLLVGTGYQWLTVQAADNYGNDRMLARYEGWQMLRVVPGLEFRTSRAFGIGLFLDFSMTAFSHVDDRVGFNGPPGSYDLSAQTINYMLGGGIRFTLFP